MTTDHDRAAMAGAVMAKLVNAHQAGLLLDTLADLIGTARAAGYEQGLADGITEGWVACEEMLANDPDDNTTTTGGTP